jgi:hypothetical protein
VGIFNSPEAMYCEDFASLALVCPADTDDSIDGRVEEIPFAVGEVVIAHDGVFWVGGSGGTVDC